MEFAFSRKHDLSLTLHTHIKSNVMTAIKHLCCQILLVCMSVYCYIYISSYTFSFGDVQSRSKVGLWMKLRNLLNSNNKSHITRVLVTEIIKLTVSILCLHIKHFLCNVIFSLRVLYLVVSIVYIGACVVKLFFHFVIPFHRSLSQVRNTSKRQW